MYFHVYCVNYVHAYAWLYKYYLHKILHSAIHYVQISYNTLSFNSWINHDSYWVDVTFIAGAASPAWSACACARSTWWFAFSMDTIGTANSCIQNNMHTATNNTHMHTHTKCQCLASITYGSRMEVYHGNLHSTLLQLCIVLCSLLRILHPLLFCEWHNFKMHVNILIYIQL